MSLIGKIQQLNDADLSKLSNRFARLGQALDGIGSALSQRLQSAADQAGLLVAMMDHGASESIYELRSKP